jgi:hypothetical protein
MHRRTFLRRGAVAAASLVVSRGRAQPATRGFFTVRRFGDRRLFATPEGAPFFSLGLNHFDSSALRSVANGRLWHERHGNSHERWLRDKVRRDLIDWKFNSVGWVQDTATHNEQNHWHSRPFTPEEYAWIGLPYCHLLPFSEIHQWEMEVRLPDFRKPGFAEACDYVARDHCARMADDPNLIGYFYSDCPVWAHAGRNNPAHGPIFDPERLKSAAGRAELSELATAYYRTTREAIRRYDPNHLILGDRYEANALLPEEVVRAALPFVDVLSFQCFGGPARVREKLGSWAKLTGHPVLLADAATYREPYPRGFPPPADRFHDPVTYRETLEVLKAIPEAVGYHLCGAYVRSPVRRTGLIAADETPDTVAIDGIRAANADIAAWAGRFR